jgi:hypothetical protein
MLTDSTASSAPNTTAVCAGANNANKVLTAAIDAKNNQNLDFAPTDVDTIQYTCLKQPHTIARKSATLVLKVDS